MRRPALIALKRQPPPQVGGGNGTSVVRSIPAPVGGWNARDPLAVMASIDALKLENWFARITDCIIRGGCANHVTGFALKPRTLSVYNGLAGTNKMFAATDGGIYDVTSAGALGASVLARTAGYHSWAQAATSAASYLIMVNGADKPAYYDGTTWTAVDAASAPALTGVTSSNLIQVNVHQRRLYFIEKNKLSFWYLPADAIGGALTEFQLGGLCNKGGYTMAMGTWTLDSGAGSDDYAVFVTSEGQAVVFVGTNPADATVWALKGVYYVGKPIGRRCFQKFGGDLLLLTEYGLFPLSKAVQAASIDIRQALSNKIEGAFIDAARSYAANPGWMIELYPAQGAALINVPTSSTTSDQYVMNTTTKSWSKFTGWNASDMVVFNKELYYADQTKIAKAWSTQADYGANIVADAQTAYTNFKDPREKQWGLFRPFLRVNGAINFSIGIAVDFDPAPTLSTATYTVVSGAIWDVSLWDQAMWAAGLEVSKDWRTPEARVGEYGSGLLKVATNSLTIQWAANDYNYITGAIVT